jgi:hypothetical protein
MRSTTNSTTTTNAATITNAATTMSRCTAHLKPCEELLVGLMVGGTTMGRGYER